MISGIPKTTDPWVLYYWFVNELRLHGFNDDFISKVIAKPPYVPRGTCSSCGFPSYHGRTIKLTPNYACVECGRTALFEVIAPPKKPHKEVFEGVIWIKWPYNAGKGEDYVMYPNVDVDKRHKYIGKPPMKMTLEWEE